MITVENKKKENNMTLIEDYKKCLGHPLYGDTDSLYLVFSLIESFVRVVDMHSEDAYLERLNFNDLNIVVFRRFLAPFIVAEGIDKTIDLFREIIRKYEMAPSFREFELGIVGSNRFLNLLINMDNRVSFYMVER